MNLLLTEWRYSFLIINISSKTRQILHLTYLQILKFAKY